MILARSGGDKLALAAVQGEMGLAGNVGGLVVTAWGLPKRRIHAVLAGAAASFLREIGRAHVCTPVTF